MRTRLLLFALLLLIPTLSFAAVVFDNQNSATVTNQVTATTTSFTITSSANRAAIVGISAVTAPTVSSVTVGGVSGSLIASTTITGNAGWTVLYCVTNPASGSQTASVTISASQDFTIGVVTASGVDQTTPCNNGTTAFTGTATSISIPVTSNSGDLTSTIVFESGTTALTDNQTIRWTQTLSGTRNIGGDTGPGTANPTHTWNGGSTFYTASGANFKAAAGGGASCPKTLLTLGVGC